MNDPSPFGHSFWTQSGEQKSPVTPVICGGERRRGVGVGEREEERERRWVRGASADDTTAHLDGGLAAGARRRLLVARRAHFRSRKGLRLRCERVRAAGAEECADDGGFHR